MQEIDFDKVKSNWETYEKLCKKAVTHGIGDFFEAVGERLVTTPSATHDDTPGCFPGGLVQTSLTTTSNMRKINDAFDMGLSTSSILKVGLLHDIGKVGTVDHDLFVEQDSSWHREKLGQMYKYNEDVPKATVPDRTLFLLQHFGITLTFDELIAIRLSQGQHLEENKFYNKSEPALAVCLQMAKRMTTTQLQYMCNYQLLREFIKNLILSEQAAEEKDDELLTEPDENHDREKGVEEFSGAAAVAGVSTPVGTGPTHPSTRKRKKKKRK